MAGSCGGGWWLAMRGGAGGGGALLRPAPPPPCPSSTLPHHPSPAAQRTPHLSALQGLVRVYTKKVGNKPDFGDPVVLRWVVPQIVACPLHVVVAWLCEEAAQVWHSSAQQHPRCTPAPAATRSEDRGGTSIKHFCEMIHKARRGCVVVRAVWAWGRLQLRQAPAPLGSTRAPLPRRYPRRPWCSSSSTHWCGACPPSTCRSGEGGAARS